jgi:hypothetical protein
MTTYLDKEAVLKAFKEEPLNFYNRFLKGEFDAPLIPPEYWRTGMAEKDVEIARLKHQLKIESEASGHVIRTAYDQITKLVSTVSLQGDRITDLEKLCDMQKATIDAQGNVLREERDRVLDDLISKFDDMNDEMFMGYMQSIRSKQTAQKEPELVICPSRKHGTCPNPPKSCLHSSPHPKKYSGDGMCDCICQVTGSRIKCVPFETCSPQPSPIPTSGTGTAPEGATISQISIGPGGNPNQNVDNLSLPEITRCIGDLTLRVDNLKIASEAHEQIFRAHGKMIQGLQQKRLMDDSRGNTFEGQIDRLETALKALQEEVKGISLTGENGTIYSLKVKREL